jgi:hypothetical protein
MAVDDVAKAVLALMDQEVWEKVADGDQSALGELELTAEEQKLVDDLVAEVAGDEVSGFGMGGSAGFAAASYVNTGGLSNAGVAKQWSAAKASIGNPGDLVGGWLNNCQKDPPPPPPPPIPGNPMSH